MCLVAQCVLHISWNLSVVLFAWQNDDGEGPELESGQKKNQTFMKLSVQVGKNPSKMPAIQQEKYNLVQFALNSIFHGTRL